MEYWGYIVFLLGAIWAIEFLVRGYRGHSYFVTDCKVDRVSLGP